MLGLDRLHVYRLARELAVRTYTMTREPPLRHHRSLADQIGRAAVSIPANIAEAYALGTRKQLIRGLRIAYGSSLELRSHLWIASRCGALARGPDAERAAEDVRRVSGMLVALLKHYGATVGG